MSNILIIGNGFDLDLGLDTSYGSFWKWYVNECPENLRNTKLFQYLKQKLEKDKWMDLESNLEYFFSPKDICEEYNAIEDEEGSLCEYEHIVLKIKEFIGIQQDKAIVNKNSLAYRMIELLNTEKVNFNIYSFNYTDLYKLGLKNTIAYEHLHGSLETEIVLGTKDDRIKKCEFNVLKKSLNNECNPSSFYRDMQNADKIVMFGHSLGIEDMAYFKPFFKEQTSSSCQQKSIYFFIKDAKSVGNVEGNMTNYYECTIGDLKRHNNVYFVHGNLKKEIMDSLFKAIGELG